MVLVYTQNLAMQQEMVNGLPAGHHPDRLAAYFSAAGGSVLRVAGEKDVTFFLIEKPTAD